MQILHAIFAYIRSVEFFLVLSNFSKKFPFLRLVSRMIMNIIGLNIIVSTVSKKVLEIGPAGQVVAYCE